MLGGEGAYMENAVVPVGTHWVGESKRKLDFHNTSVSRFSLDGYYSFLLGGYIGSTRASQLVSG